MTGGHPLALPPVNHTAPVPRRIRAVLDGHIVVDTTSGCMCGSGRTTRSTTSRSTTSTPRCWLDEQHEQKLSRGTARRYALQVGEIVRPAALLIYGDDATVEGLADRARPGRVLPWR
ncbi:MAG: hypothetical protein ACLP8X_22190 [Streptosporangiaceae bacterium]